MTPAEHTQLIGKTASIIDSDNAELIGITGVISNETKHSITIKGKKYLKHLITLKINNKIIKGNTITKHISERLKVKK